MIREGISFVMPTLDARGVLPKKELRLGLAESLQVMTEEYTFFTPAILYLLGLTTDAPLIDFQFEKRCNVDFYYRKFAHPIFRGLETPDGDSDWNHALWAVRKEVWQDFYDFYSSLAFTDGQRRYVTHMASQVIDVVDPLAMARAGLILNQVPTCIVTAFGANGNTLRAAFEIGVSPLLDRPRLRFYAPSPAMVVFADALYTGKNPHIERDLYLQTQQAKKGNGDRT